MKDTRLVSQEVVERDHDLVFVVETSTDVLNTATRDLDQHRWEQVACKDNPNRVTHAAYAKAVGVIEQTIDTSVKAWTTSLSYDRACSDPAHGGTELTETKKPSPDTHKKARNRASVGALNVAIAEALQSSFVVDTEVSSISRNGNWRNRRTAVKAILEYNHPADEEAQLEAAASAADEVRTEWLRIEMALSGHGVAVPTTDTMLDSSLSRWAREQEFSFRTAVDTELANLATELKAEAKKVTRKNEAHGVRYMEAATKLATIKKAYKNLLDIVDGVEFNDEEHELLGIDLAEIHSTHVHVVDATETEDVILGIQMDALTTEER